MPITRTRACRISLYKWWGVPPGRIDGKMTPAAAGGKGKGEADRYDDPDVLHPTKRLQLYGASEMICRASHAAPIGRFRGAMAERPRIRAMHTPRTDFAGPRTDVLGEPSIDVAAIGVGSCVRLQFQRGDERIAATVESPCPLPQTSAQRRRMWIRIGGISPSVQRCGLRKN